MDKSGTGNVLEEFKGLLWMTGRLVGEVRVEGTYTHTHTHTHLSGTAVGPSCLTQLPIQVHLNWCTTQPVCRQEAGGKMQETGGRTKEAGSRRQEVGRRRQEVVAGSNSGVIGGRTALL